MGLIKQNEDNFSFLKTSEVGVPADYSHWQELELELELGRKR